MSNIILANKDEYQKIIAEEKEEWLYQVLVGLGVSEDFLVESSNKEVIDYLTSLGIEVFNNLGDGSIEILREGEVVAQWKEPKLILIKEKTGPYYYEIHLNEWALPFQMRRKNE